MVKRRSKPSGFRKDFKLLIVLPALVTLEVLLRVVPGKHPGDFMFQGYSLENYLNKQYLFSKKTMTWKDKGSTRVTLNSDGYRGHNFGLKRGRYRIAAMGDSKVFGLWVDDNKT